MANKLFSTMSTSFESFDRTVQQYLTKTLNSIGSAYSNSQIYVVIFNAIKGVMQNALLYVEDALTEQNVFTASRKKSIYSLAKISGYDPYYGAAATGNIKVTMKVANNNNTLTKIYLKNHSRLVNKNTGYTYVLMMNSNNYVFDLTSPIITHELKVVQGNYVSNSYTATGSALEKISVSISSLFDRQYFDVFVNGEKWTQVSSLYDMTKGSKTYVLTVGYENTFDVMFGNGIYGQIPDAGSYIEIKYIIHDGTSGNIHLNESTKFAFIENGYDALNNSVNLNDYVNISVSDVISGGINADDISFIREMIGANSRSNVLASEESYKLFFKRFSFIGYVNCFCEPNTMNVTAICTSNKLNEISSFDNYYNIRTSGRNNEMLLTEDQKAMIKNTLVNSNKAFVGMSLTFEDPKIRRFAVLTYIKITDEYSKALVKQHISDAWAAYFMSKTNDFKFIPKSDLIAVALNADANIKSIDITIISELAEQTYANGYYVKDEQQYVNGVYKYVQKKVYYEADAQPGLDPYGNISLDSDFEIPVLSNGIHYYSDKETGDKSSPVTLSAIEFFFI